MSRPYFITGALGCIGAWVVERLLARGDRPIVFDTGGDPYRIRDLVDERGLDAVQFVTGDVTDANSVRAALEASGATRVVHLAGLQVPTCRANPAAGAAVNVLGTVHVLQAAADLGAERVAYASSAAVYGPDDAGPDGGAPTEDTVCHPTTHYGVYKQANEGNAAVFFAERGLSSVALRPLTVYGVGRDQGMTSDPTRAIKAAIVGRPFRIRFGGATDFLLARDCAEAFLAAVDRSPEGAHVFNLHGETHAVAHALELLEGHVPAAADLITLDGPPIPIPPALDGAQLAAALPGLPRTPLAEGIAATVERFRELQAAGRLRTAELED